MTIINKNINNSYLKNIYKLISKKNKNIVIHLFSY